MTFWAKLFVVILFVLSIIFASISGVLFAKREHYRENYKKLQDAHEREITKLSDTVAQLEGDVDDARTARSIAEDNLRNRERDYEKIDSQYKQLAINHAEVKTRLAKVEGDNLLFASSVETLSMSNAELVTSNHGLSTRNLTLETTLRTRDTTIAELETTRTQLSNEVTDLKVALEDKRKKLDEAEAIFAELWERGIEPRTVIGSHRIIPDIQAKITGVDLDTGLVVLNAGSEAGVRKNFDFTVYRGDKYIATVRVFHREQNQSAAKIVIKNADVEIGDNARTQLP